MHVEIFGDPTSLGQKAGRRAAGLLREAIANNGRANLILATGASQFETLDAFVSAPDIDWSKVAAFHLDEYIGLSRNHPASFRKYLQERFIDRVSGIGRMEFIDGEADPEEEIARLSSVISVCRIDLAFVGIGENTHLAFNDPPADFETDAPYLIVELDEQCRRQQLGEGWFEALADVPARAISMSIRQILKSRKIICSVPDRRKAEAVRRTLLDPIDPACPASILRKHDAAWLYLDVNSAALLNRPCEDVE